MKRSKWFRAVQKCVFSARLKARSDKSGGRSAGGKRFHVADVDVLQLQSGRVEPVHWGLSVVLFLLCVPVENVPGRPRQRSSFIGCILL